MMLVFLFFQAQPVLSYSNGLCDCKLPTSEEWWFNNGVARNFTDLDEFCKEQRYAINNIVYLDKVNDKEEPSKEALQNQFYNVEHDFVNYKKNWSPATNLYNGSIWKYKR